MLSELRVEGLGVIEELRLSLGPGMTAVTGETGAGKTLVVGAIQLLTGARADSAVVRSGAEEAVVDGRFDCEAEVVLSRAVPASGRSRAYRDGRPITAAELAEQGSALVELHGQHAHQVLLRGRAQREALDTFGDIDRRPLETARRQVRELRAELERLGGDERSRARELDLVRFQLDELDAAAIDDVDEDDRLRDEESVLGDARAHREAAAAAEVALDRDDGARDQLAGALAHLEDRPPFAQAASRLRGLLAEVDDVAGELRAAAEGIVDDPQRLAEIQQRRTTLTELRRKYGATLSEVVEERERLRERLEELEGHDERAAALAGELATAEQVTAREAARIGDARRKVAPDLARRVQEHLAELAMADARVEVLVSEEDPGDDVSFQLAANPGSALQPLAKVASGGELARTMLALRLVLSGGPPTAVFDEVDAGIGGAAAGHVASALARVAAERQVLVVTHLPQVAAVADAHVVVEKTTDGTATRATVRQLAGREEREVELARMLSGHPDSDAARRHARELLDG